MKTNKDWWKEFMSYAEYLDYEEMMDQKYGKRIEEDKQKEQTEKVPVGADSQQAKGQ